jgi:hypothetical protein
MHESHGELLIGGDTLHHVQVELEQEVREPEAWLLSGRIRISPQQAEILELHRHYLLQLDDGRAGPIALTRMEPQDGVLLALFQPDVRRPRS